MKAILLKGACLLLLPAFLLLSCQKNPYEIKKLAINYSKEKKYSEALTEINKLIEIKSNDSEAYLFRGFLNMKLGNYETAYEDFQKSSDLGDKVKVKYVMKEYTDRKINHFPIQDLEELKIFLDGIVKAKTGNQVGAKADFDKVIHLNPLNYEAYYLRAGDEFYIEKDHTQALKDLYKALYIYPSHSNAYYLKGNIFQNLGILDSAISNYSKSIILNPQFVEGQHIYQAGPKGLTT